MTAEAQLPQSTALDEARPESLGEITNLDPEKWTDAQIDKMVSALREQATRYAANKDAPKPTKSTALPKPKADKASQLGLSIDDLGI